MIQPDFCLLQTQIRRRFRKTILLLRRRISEWKWRRLWRWRKSKPAAGPALRLTEDRLFATSCMFSRDEPTEFIIKRIRIFHSPLWRPVIHIIAAVNQANGA